MANLIYRWLSFKRSVFSYVNIVKKKKKMLFGWTTYELSIRSYQHKKATACEQTPKCLKEFTGQKDWENLLTYSCPNSNNVAWM